MTRPTYNLLPFASASHAYLIVAGIVLGVLASPGVLGKAAPEIHRQIFGGADPAQVQAMRDALQAEIDTGLDALAETTVSKEAVDEFLAERDPQWRAIEQAPVREAALGIAPMTTAAVLALVVVMLLESVFAPTVDATGRARVPPMLGRLVTVRYGLIALWVMLMIAQPAALWAMNPTFALVLVLVALVTGLIPLGRKADA